MSEQSNILTIKERYKKLSKKDKVTLRDSFLRHFEYKYPTFYPKLNNDAYKAIEREYIEEQLTQLEKATNTDIN